MFLGRAVERVRVSTKFIKSCHSFVRGPKTSSNGQRLCSCAKDALPPAQGLVDFLIINRAVEGERDFTKISERSHSLVRGPETSSIGRRLCYFAYVGFGDRILLPDQAVDGGRGFTDIFNHCHSLVTGPATSSNLQRLWDFAYMPYVSSGWSCLWRDVLVSRPNREL